MLYIIIYKFLILEFNILKNLNIIIIIILNLLLLF